MRVQFSKDDDGKVWLSYAKDIIVRKIKFDYEKHHIMKEVQNSNQQAKVELVTEINKHLDSKCSAKSIYSIYTVMDKHYNTMKDGIGISKWMDEDSIEDENDCIVEEAYKMLRPSSPYKLKELISKEKFDPKKYVEQKRVEERMLGGRTFFRSIVVKDPEDLRKSIMQNKEFITSPKMFCNKEDFSELKQNNRLVHQFYSTEVNAPVELK